MRMFGPWMQVGDERFNTEAIRNLYESSDYPLRRRPLAFLAPDLVKAAIDGRLPHGMGVARLADLPAGWSLQHQMLGLPAQ